MTKISDIIDEFNDVCEAQLTGYRHMAKPEVPEDQSNLVLQKGYGLVIGPAENDDRGMDCIVQQTRQVALVLINQMAALEHDPDGRVQAKKDLLEDLYKMVKAIEQNFALTATNDPDQKAANASYRADSGIAYLGTEGAGEHVMIIAYFDMTYIESLP